MTSSAATAVPRPAAPRTAACSSGARRIVVKVGSSSLTSIKGGISEESLTALADALAAKRNSGTEIILVSSGAIAAGLAPLGLAKRPRDLATQQAAASVGQGLLMARYTQAFGAHGVTVSQVLLTADDLMRRSQHTNAFRALDRLLNLGVVPVVNENDTVATHEIRFGDNDRLAALVAHLVRADALVLLSDVDSLYDGPPSHGAKRIPLVEGPHDLDGVTIGKAGKAGVGTGGMTTKVEAATIAAGSGIHALVTSTANAAAALAGEDVGTWFTVNGARKPVRLLWLAHLAYGPRPADPRRRRGQGSPPPPHVAAPRRHFRRRRRLRSGRRRRNGQRRRHRHRPGTGQLLRRRTAPDAWPFHQGTGQGPGPRLRP